MTRAARRWWEAAAALAVLNVLAAAFLLLPAREGRARQEDQLLDLQRRVRALQREGQSGQALAAAVREMEEFSRGFPPREEAVELKAELTRLARKLSLDVPAVSYVPTELKEAGLIKVTLTLGVEGPYPNIRRYLYDLEGMRRHLVIERVALRDPRGTADLQLQLQLGLYLRTK